MDSAYGQGRSAKQQLTALEQRLDLWTQQLLQPGLELVLEQAPAHKPEPN